MRYFRTSLGWLQDTVNPVNVPMEDSEAAVSAYYGFPVMGVEVADGDPDPRTGDLLPVPERDKPAPEPTLQDKYDALLAVVTKLAPDAVVASAVLAPDVQEASRG